MRERPPSPTFLTCGSVGERLADDHRECAPELAAEYVDHLFARNSARPDEVLVNGPVAGWTQRLIEHTEYCPEMHRRPFAPPGNRRGHRTRKVVA
jgi:hypothetical protein